jgi:outer membrane receptor protein involved in Fe transport
MNGSLILNGDVFYYKENGYQISQIVNKSSVNTNINANLYGVEFEGVWEPIHHFTVNTNIGYLHTEITSGSIVDQMDITQGNPNLTLVKASDGSNCAVNTAGLARFLAVQEGLGGINVPGVTGNSEAILGICPVPGNSGAGVTSTTQTPLDLALGITPSAGVPVSLKGKELPNSPDFTVSLGAQYVYDLPRNWIATLRGDYYWQDSSYARVFNTVQDHLKGYDVVNATLTFNRPDIGLNIQLYVKNAFNSQPITDTYLTDASSGLFENTFTLDPRTFGISVTKKF